MKRQAKVDNRQAYSIFSQIVLVTHGIASLLANNAMVYDEAYCINILSNAYFGIMYLIKERDLLRKNNTNIFSVRKQEMKMSKSENWILCSVCGNKTRLQIRADTELKNFPLYCPKCKQESLIEAKHLQVTVIKEPDA